MIALSIGKVTYDTTLLMDNFPVENSKMVLKEKLEASGGSASNVAYLLGKWNIDSYFSGIIGYDELGTTIKKELDSNHVHTNFVEINYERKTTSTLILVNKNTTSRTQIMVEPEIYHLKKYDYDVSPEIIYADGYEYSATLEAFNKNPNAITVIGAGLNYADEKEITALAKFAKYVIFSLEFACKVTKMTVNVENGSHLFNLYKELSNYFPNSINIVTLHNNGVLYSIDNNVKIMPTINVKELDRTGSGDVFDGAFIYGLSKNYDLEKSLRIANISAALSTAKYGAKNSVPLLSDVIQEYEKRFGSVEAISIPTNNSSIAPNATPQNNVAPANIPNNFSGNNTIPNTTGSQAISQNIPVEKGN